MSGGTIAGIVIGIVVGLPSAIVALLTLRQKFWRWLKRRFIRPPATEDTLLQAHGTEDDDTSCLRA